MTDARTPSDHHQDAQDALVEDRSMRPPNAMRFRRDFHSEDARERAQEDADLEEAAQHPFAGYVTSAGAATHWGDDVRLVGSAGGDEHDEWGGSAA